MQSTALHNFRFNPRPLSRRKHGAAGASAHCCNWRSTTFQSTPAKQAEARSWLPFPPSSPCFNPRPLSRRKHQRRLASARRPRHRQFQSTPAKQAEAPQGRIYTCRQDLRGFNPRPLSRRKHDEMRGWGQFPSLFQSTPAKQAEALASKTATNATVAFQSTPAKQAEAPSLDRDVLRFTNPTVSIHAR